MAFIPRKTEVGKKGPLLGGEASLMKLKGSFKGSSGARKSPILGGKDSFEKMRAGLKKPLHAKEVKKEVKKDTSIFGEKKQEYVSREAVRNWLRRVEAWKITKLSVKERPKLEKKLFNPKDPRNFGINIDRVEAGNVLKDLENFPDRSKTRYGMKNRSETRRARNLLRKFVGK